MDQSVDHQLTHDIFLERRDSGSKQPIRDLVAFAKVRDLLPERIDKLDWRQREVIPDELADLRSLLIVLERLDHRSGSEARALYRRAHEEHAEVGEQCAAGQPIVREQLLVGLLLYGRLHAI